MYIDSSKRSNAHGTSDHVCFSLTRVLHVPSASSLAVDKIQNVSMLWPLYSQDLFQGEEVHLCGLATPGYNPLYLGWSSLELHALRSLWQWPHLGSWEG